MASGSIPLMKSSSKSSTEKLLANKCHSISFSKSNVYEREPQDLEWNESTALSNGERFYYCSRTMKETATTPSRLTGLCMNIALNQEPRSGGFARLNIRENQALQEEIESMIKKQHSSRNDFETGSSTNVGVELDQERSLVPADSAMPLDDHYNQQPHNQWSNMQQLPWPLSPPCHPDDLPAPPSTSGGHYCVNYQQEELEPIVHEQPFPNLWSWMN
ncbi:hypothetical protein OIU77_002983 [Salix suchowensis]|uniref:Uncharacterized protein n=1 Tax=Salix suchowensis TaxID=1278906 RepID=A0ABQ9B066_9ROSI|nr:hypothetical protein OIU77_002983 [Salix suchowensis]